MTSKRELEAQVRKLQAAAEEAAVLAEAQMGNVQRLTRKVNAHRRVVIDHIRTCQADFPDDERVQLLTVALITELDVAGLNISAEVRVSPRAAAS